VNYTDDDHLHEECDDGRRLGFDGKVRTNDYIMNDRVLANDIAASDSPETGGNDPIYICTYQAR
jgi:hypothetical protein